MYAFLRCLGLACLAVAGFTFPASAHITFENKDVKAGSTAKFILRVPHGCSGAATTGIRIALPATLSDIKPQPKPGWTLSIVTDDVQKTSTDDDLSSGRVKEIDWTGGRLEDADYDEFVFRATASKTASGRLFVPVIQQCDGDAVRWIEIPGDGASSEDMKNPAPSIRVQP